MTLRIEFNIESQVCNCFFPWIVMDENNRSVFGAYTEAECIAYVQAYKEI